MKPIKWLWFLPYVLSGVAHASPSCVFDSSGISINAISHSKQVTHFKIIQPHKLYLGYLKGVGTFELQEYACNHRGVVLSVLVDPAAPGQSVPKLLYGALALLLKPNDLKSIEPQLADLTEQDLTQPRSFPDIAPLLGFDDFSVQWGEVNGAALMVLRMQAN